MPLGCPLDTYIKEGEEEAGGQGGRAKGGVQLGFPILVGFPFLFQEENGPNMHHSLQSSKPLCLMVLTGIDFVRCWISWSILPLSHRPGLMCEYTGNSKDPQRHTDIQLTDVEVTEAVKTILDESVVVCRKTGLCPFCVLNKPPAVRIA